MAMDQPSLTVTGLSKRFGDQVVLDDVSFQIRQGSRVALIGKNGAGKSTLLRLLLGLLPKDQGQIQFGQNGSDPRGFVGYLPEQPPVYDYLTGMEYLEYVGALWSLPRMRMTELAEAYLHRFDLWPDRASLIGAYSKGMKRKIALIGVLIREPTLLLFDEPFDGLDGVAVERLIQLLCQSEVTLLFTCHSADLVDRVALERLSLHEGKVRLSAEVEGAG